MSFSYKKGLAYYIPISENQEEAQKTVEIFVRFLKIRMF
jgi:DNA polymerase-1